MTGQKNETKKEALKKVEPEALLDALEKAQVRANRQLGMQLRSKGVTYKDLVKLLRAIDVIETERSLQGKIGRGSFTFAFFLQCMRVLGITKVDLDQ